MLPKFCPECGTKAPSIAAKFCSSCGNSLDIFASKSSPSKKVVARQSDIDEDDEDGSDVFSVPSLSSVRASSKVTIEGEDGIGFSSFSFGEAGFQPTTFASKKR